MVLFNLFLLLSLGLAQENLNCATEPIAEVQKATRQSKRKTRTAPQKQFIRRKPSLKAVQLPQLPDHSFAYEYR